MTGPVTSGTAPDDLVGLVALSTGYATAVDSLDGEGFAALFVADGELVVPNYPDDLRPVITRSGHDALARIPAGLARYDRTFHQVTNHQFAVDGPMATGQVMGVAHHILAATDPVGTGPAATDTVWTDTVWTDTVWFIRYADSYRRTDDGWRFARRELHLQWVEHHPVVAVGEPVVDRFVR